MATHVYLIGDINDKAIDLAAVRAEIKAANDARRKPGNLAAAGELTLSEIRDYKKGIVPAGIFKVSVSSQVARDPLQETGYFLQDGICENIPATLWPLWMPNGKDAQPWMQYDFGKKVKFSKVVVWSLVNKPGDKTTVRSAEVQIFKDGKWCTVGKIANNTALTFTITFPAVEADKMRLLITGKYGSVRLSEVEIY